MAQATTFAQRAAKTTLFGGLVGGTFSLGCWQTQRYGWKTELLEKRAENLRRPPLPLPECATAETLPPDLAERGRRVVVAGAFDPERTARVGPRSPPPGLMQRAPGLGTGPQGYALITVMKRADGSEVLVDRGWAPKGARVAPCPTVETEVVAVASPGEARGTFSPENTPKHVLWVELPWLRRHLGVADDALLLQCCPDVDSGAYPRPRAPEHLATAAVTPATHAGYAFTWFALSAAGGVMCVYV